MKSRLRPLCVFVLSLVFTQWGRRGLFRAEVWHQDQPGVQRMRSKGIRRMPVINEEAA